MLRGVDKVLILRSKSFVALRTDQWRGFLSYLIFILAKYSLFPFPPRLAVRTVSNIDFIPMDEIIMIKAEGNYSHLYLKNGNTVLACMNLKSIQEKLDHYLFVRSHKSFIVNLRSVLSINKANCELYLEKGHVASLSKGYQDDIIEKLESGNAHTTLWSDKDEYRH